jgi:hypothetical protein
MFTALHDKRMRFPWATSALSHEGQPGHLMSLHPSHPSLIMTPRVILALMNDLLSKTLEEVRKEAEGSGMRIFYGYLAEEKSVPTVHWNRENGGDWKKFLVCARTLSATILYVSWAPFEQFEIDDAVSTLESELTQDESEDKETRKLLSQIPVFQAKVGLTCEIDLAFIANGVVHLYQETADWFDEFGSMVGEDDEDEEEVEERRPASKAVVNKWATALASHPKYPTIKQHDYLLEKIAGDEFSQLPKYEVLRRAEMIYQTDFREAAERTLAKEIQELRSQGLNLNAIAQKLGISRDRVSGLTSVVPTEGDT